MKKVKNEEAAKSVTPFINRQIKWLKEEMSYLEKSKGRLIKKQYFGLAAAVREAIKLIDGELKSLRNFRRARQR